MHQSFSSSLSCSFQSSSTVPFDCSAVSPITHNHTVEFNKELMPQDEVAVILLSSGMDIPQTLEWFERRLKVGRFTPKQ